MSEKLLCRIFGHDTRKNGWWGDGLYGELSGGCVDGCGRSHFQVHLQCQRGCGEVLVARFHGTRGIKVENGRIVADGASQ